MKISASAVAFLAVASVQAIPSPHLVERDVRQITIDFYTDARCESKPVITTFIFPQRDTDVCTPELPPGNAKGYKVTSNNATRFLHVYGLGNCNQSGPSDAIAPGTLGCRELKGFNSINWTS